MKYVLAIIFDEFSNVLFMKKNKPDFMANMFNGVGGKVEEGETPVEAIVREVREETNLNIEKDKWTLVCKMINNEHVVNVFTVKIPNDQLKQMQQMEEEFLLIENMYDCRHLNKVPNLDSLIHLSHYKLNATLTPPYNTEKILYG